VIQDILVLIFDTVWQVTSMIYMHGLVVDRFLGSFFFFNKYYNGKICDSKRLSH